MFPMLTGGVCSYDETLAVSGAGAFTFDYVSPFLYVVDEGSSQDGILKIYDVSSPSAPSLLSTTALPTDSGPRNPRYISGKLFIPYRDTNNVNRQVTIWNVDNPASPFKVGETINMAGATAKPFDIDVIGNILAVAVSTGTYYIEKHDISDPANPAFVAGRTNTGGLNCTGVRHFGNVFYVIGQGGSGAPAFLVSVNPDTWGFFDSISATNGAGSGGDLVIHSDGVHLYAPLNNSNRLWAVDITDPANLATFSEVAMTQTGTQTSATGSIVLIEATQRLYIGRPNGGGLLIPIMDITNKDTPAVSGSISTNGETVTDLAVLTGCSGFAWGQGTGATIHLLGTAPTS